jgi:hypothetical protein
VSLAEAEAEEAKALGNKFIQVYTADQHINIDTNAYTL